MSAPNAADARAPEATASRSRPETVIGVAAVSTACLIDPPVARGVARVVIQDQPSATMPKSAVVWSYMLTVGRLVTTAVVTVVMAAYLLPADYGVMALAMVWVTFAQTLALHGTGQAVIQRDKVDDSHFDAAFWTTVGGSVLLAGLFAGVAPLWAHVTGTPELVPVCFALAPAIVLNALVVVPDAILRRQLRFRTLSLRVLIAGVLSGFAGVGAAVAGLGVWALVIQQMVLTSISAVAVWAAVPWRPHFRRIGPALKDIRSYSLHSVSGFFAGFLSERTDALLLGPIFGPVAIGLYRFPSRITSMVNDVAVGGLSQVSLPHLSRFAPDRKALADGIGRVIHAGSLIALPLFGILYASGPWLLTWIGPQWTPAGPAFQALCIGSAAGALGAITGAALQAAGRPGTIAAIGWCTAAVTAGLMFGVGRAYSSRGADAQVFAIAVTYTAIQVVSMIVALVIVFRVVLGTSTVAGLRPSLPAAAAAAAAVAAGLGLQPAIHGMHAFWGLAATGVVSTIAAAAVLALTDREVGRRVWRVVGPRRRGRHSKAAMRAGVTRAGRPTVAASPAMHANGASPADSAGGTHHRTVPLNGVAPAGAVLNGSARPPHSAGVNGSAGLSHGAGVNGSAGLSHGAGVNGSASASATHGAEVNGSASASATHGAEVNGSAGLNGSARPPHGAPTGTASKGSAAPPPGTAVWHGKTIVGRYRYATGVYRSNGSSPQIAYNNNGHKEI